MASSVQAPIPAPQNDAPWRHRAITSGLSRVLELLKEDSQPMEQIAAAAALNLCKQIRSQLIDRIYTTKVDTQTESQSEKIRSIVPKKHTQSAGVLLNLGQPTSSQLPVSQSAPQLAASRSEPQLQVKSQENAVLPWAPLPPAPLFGNVEQVLLRKVGPQEKLSHSWRRFGRRLRLKTAYLNERWLEQAREDLHVAQTAAAYRKSRHESAVAIHKMRLHQLGAPERTEEIRLAEEEAMAERVRAATEAAIQAEEKKRRARQELAVQSAMRLPRWYTSNSLQAAKSSERDARFRMMLPPQGGVETMDPTVSTLSQIQVAKAVEAKFTTLPQMQMARDSAERDARFRMMLSAQPNGAI